MEAHLLEWLNLSVRWVHMITGVAWIGASFYFVWLENNLNRVNPKDGLSGDLWAIHGGGIYHLEKYKLAPPTMPDNLHWFKWEAYFTWMSGVALLCVVFYLNPTLYLLAPGSSLSGTEGVLLGIGSLFAGWFIYSFLCDSALGKRPALLGLILFVLLIAAAYGFSTVFSGRGAYLHVGAIIGTIMVGNVFRIIMPAQRALVAAIAEQPHAGPGPAGQGLAAFAAQQLLHLAGAVHHDQQPLPEHLRQPLQLADPGGDRGGGGVGAALLQHPAQQPEICLDLAGGRVGDDLPGLCHRAEADAPKWPRHQRPSSTSRCRRPHWAAARNPLAPAAPAAAPAPAQATVDFDKVHGVIQARCAVCHSAKPTSPLFSTAPAGVMFDTPTQIQQQAARIQAQAVASQIMPLGNITQMTQQERDLIGTWINQRSTPTN